MTLLTLRQPDALQRLLLTVFACLMLQTTAWSQHQTVRIATFNVSLNRPKAGALQSDLESGSAQAAKVAKILRIIRPDIVLLNEFDFDATGRSVEIFREKYLESQHDENEPSPIRFPHAYFAPVNTGEASGMDLDHDGKTDGPADAFGFGQFPGQYGMVVLSRHPIDSSAVQTFQHLLWKDLPDAQQPSNPATGTPWYTDAVWRRLRLSSKSHWAVPVKIGQQTINIIASHPTPPAFDGPEDRNGCRNHDEIELIRHIIEGQRPGWLITDSGQQGGLAPKDSFVICGDLNSDPVDGGSRNEAIRKLLTHARVRDTQPASLGAVETSKLQGGVNRKHTADARLDTADFSDNVVGNLRVDYCLPSRDLAIVDSGVFWPPADSTDSTGSPHSGLLDCSDHRLVWVDLRFEDPTSVHPSETSN